MRALGTPADERLDRIIRLARRIFQVPVARIDLDASAPSGHRERPADGASRRPFAFDIAMELRLQNRPVGVLRICDAVPRILDGAQREMLHELAAMAEQQIGECALQIELAEENELLRTKAFVDGLTRVWNREAIIEIALREIDVAREDHRPVGFAIVDIDHFKEVNDCHGHAVGDAVLREISAHLRAGVRATDAVGRYGGDEFLIVMPDCTLKAGVAASQRIRRAIAAAPIEVEGGVVNVTASFGVAVCQTEAGPIGDLTGRGSRPLPREGPRP